MKFYIAFASLLLLLATACSPVDPPSGNYKTTSSTDEQLQAIGIDDIDLSFTARGVEMSVHTPKPMSCNTLYGVLKIENIKIDEVTYSPRCKQIDNTHLKITYEVQTTT